MSIPHVIRTPQYGGEQKIEANPLLNAGERAWSYTTKQVKIGDGVRRWDELPVAKVDYPKLDELLAQPEMQRIAEEAATRERGDPLLLIAALLNPGL